MPASRIACSAADSAKRCGGWRTDELAIGDNASSNSLTSAAMRVEKPLASNKVTGRRRFVP
jgi:hypothetical protein